ncbi:MAG: hypothetical protein R3F59_30565 [Myxococcota bacterium]
MIRVLFGRTRTARRRALAAAGVGRIDAFGRPTFLYLTGTPDKARQLRRGVRGPRRLRARRAHLRRLVRGLGGSAGATAGRCCRSARSGCTPGACSRARGDRWPSLAGSPTRPRRGACRGARPPDGRRGAAAHRPRAARGAGGAAGRGPRDGRRAAHRGAAGDDRGARSWRGRPRAHGALIVDDLFGLSPLEGATLAALCRATDRLGADVFLATASGRDRGGAEVLALIGVDPPEGRRAHRAFAATAAVRAAAMALVEQGDAELLVARDGGWAEVEPWVEASEPAPPDLADAYAEGIALPAVAMGPVRVIGAATIRAPRPPG